MTKIPASPAGRALGIGLLASASAVAACERDEPRDAPAAAVPAQEQVAGPPRPRPRASEELIGLDLSDEAVAELTVEELWELGVRHLAWPPERPAGATKNELHQRLLEGKYRDVGDFGYGDRPAFGFEDDN